MNTSPVSPPPPFVAPPATDGAGVTPPPAGFPGAAGNPATGQPPGGSVAPTPTNPPAPPLAPPGAAGAPPADTTPPPPAEPPAQPPAAEPPAADPPAAEPPAASDGSECEALVPASAEIDLSTVDAMDQWGDTTEFFGGFYSYPNERDLDFSGGTLAVSTTVNEYSGFGLWFGPCADLSGFEGIQFDVSGLGDEELAVAIQSHATYIYDDSEEYPKGGCIPDDPDEPWTSCVYPKKTGITDGTGVQIAWSEFAGGVPEAKTDGSQILGIQFEFTWPGDEREIAVEVSNISFY